MRDDTPPLQRRPELANERAGVLGETDLEQVEAGLRAALDLAGFGPIAVAAPLLEVPPTVSGGSTL